MNIKIFPLMSTIPDLRKRHKSVQLLCSEPGFEVFHFDIPAIQNARAAHRASVIYGSRAVLLQVELIFI